MGAPRCTNSTITTEHKQPFLFAIGERYVTADYTVGSEVCSEAMETRRQSTVHHLLLTLNSFRYTLFEGAVFYTG